MRTSREYYRSYFYPRSKHLKCILLVFFEREVCNYSGEKIWYPVHYFYCFVNVDVIFCMRERFFYIYYNIHIINIYIYSTHVTLYISMLRLCYRVIVILCTSALESIFVIYTLREICTSGLSERSFPYTSLQTRESASFATVTRHCISKRESLFFIYKKKMLPSRGFLNDTCSLFLLTYGFIRNYLELVLSRDDFTRVVRLTSDTNGAVRDNLNTVVLV